jgi:hypothetical protein
MPVPRTMNAMLLTGHGGPEKWVFENNWPTPDISPECADCEGMEACPGKIVAETKDEA